MPTKAAAEGGFGAKTSAKKKIVGDNSPLHLEPAGPFFFMFTMFSMFFMFYYVFKTYFNVFMFTVEK